MSTATAAPSSSIPANVESTVAGFTTDLRRLRE